MSPTMSNTLQTISSNSKWLLGLMMVSFDELTGPIIESQYPLNLSDSILPKRITDLSFLSLPDSVYHGDSGESILFSYILPFSVNPSPLLSSTDAPYIYAFVYFHRKPDVSRTYTTRGCIQNSFVLLTTKPHIIFFEQLATVIGSYIVNNSKSCNETLQIFEKTYKTLEKSSFSLCNTISSAYIPDSETQQSFELFNTLFTFTCIPTKTSAAQKINRIRNLNVSQQHPNPLSPNNLPDFHFLLFSKPIFLDLSDYIYPIFTSVITHLWTIWSIILTGESFVVFGKSPTITSRAVYLLTSLISPLEYIFSGNIVRTVFTLQDSDFDIILSQHPSTMKPKLKNMQKLTIQNNTSRDLTDSSDSSGSNESNESHTSIGSTSSVNIPLVSKRKSKIFGQSIFNGPLLGITNSLLLQHLPNNFRVLILDKIHLPGEYQSDAGLYVNTTLKLRNKIKRQLVPASSIGNSLNLSSKVSLLSPPQNFINLLDSINSISSSQHTILASTILYDHFHSLSFVFFNPLNNFVVSSLMPTNSDFLPFFGPPSLAPWNSLDFFSFMERGGWDTFFTYIPKVFEIPPQILKLLSTIHETKPSSQDNETLVSNGIDDTISTDGTKNKNNFFDTKIHIPKNWKSKQCWSILYTRFFQSANFMNWLLSTQRKAVEKIHKTYIQKCESCSVYEVLQYCTYIWFKENPNLPHRNNTKREFIDISQLVEKKSGQLYPKIGKTFTSIPTKVLVNVYKRIKELMLDSLSKCGYSVVFDQKQYDKLTIRQKDSIVNLHSILQNKGSTFGNLQKKLFKVGSLLPKKYETLIKREVLFQKNTRLVTYLHS